jgi:hypothetical protein
MGFGSSKQNSNNQSQQTSESKNQAFPFIQEQFGSQTALTSSSSNAIANLLGLNGATGQDEGFKKFRESGGYNFIKDEGLGGITASNASKGLLNSGSALKKITTYGTNLASNFLNSYLAQLAGLSDTGLKAGQLISSAGNTANSQGTSFGTSSGSSLNASLG